MTEMQIIILQAELRQRGIPEAKTLRIIELLADKPVNVQLAFYYRCLGLIHAEIADLIGCSERHVKNLLEKSKNCI